MWQFIRSIKTPGIILVVAVLLIFLHFIGWLSFAENIVVKILSPVNYQVYKIGAGFNSFYSNITPKGDLTEANVKLENEVKELIVENSQLRTLIQENKELSVQQNFLQNNGYEAISAKVIGKSQQSDLQSIILNKGSNDGVVINQPLITAEGILVGKILDVRPSNSLALLIDDPKSKVAAVIQNDSFSQGVVTGEHGLSLKMTLIPQNEKVEIGDVVVTSGAEETIARGLVIGKVTRVEIEPNEVFQTAYLQPLVNIDNLTVVSILTSPYYGE